MNRSAPDLCESNPTSDQESGSQTAKKFLFPLKERGKLVEVSADHISSGLVIFRGCFFVLFATSQHSHFGMSAGLSANTACLLALLIALSLLVVCFSLSSPACVLL